MKTFMWPTVLTTWAEEKRIRPYIIYSLRSQGHLRESEEVFISERMTTRTMSQTGSSWYFAEFLNIALAVFFSNTPKKHALFPKQTLEKDITVESGFLFTISYFKYFLPE